MQSSLLNILPDVPRLVLIWMKSLTLLHKAMTTLLSTPMEELPGPLELIIDVILKTLSISKMMATLCFIARVKEHYGHWDIQDLAVHTI